MSKLTEILKKLDDKNINYNVKQNSPGKTLIEIYYDNSGYPLCITLNKHEEIYAELSDRPEFKIQVSLERAINIIDRFIKYND